MSYVLQEGGNGNNPYSHYLQIHFRQSSVKIPLAPLFVDSSMEEFQRPKIRCDISYLFILIRTVYLIVEL